jgi:hypothetical protein
MPAASLTARLRSSDLIATTARQNDCRNGHGRGPKCGTDVRAERLRAEYVIAVGTALASGPPRRSQRALLTHWAPALGSGVEAHVREGMLHAGGW